MKKMLSTLLVIIIILFTLIACNNETSQKPTENPTTDFEYEINEDNTITITKYIGSSENVVIPEKIEGINVKEVGKNAFKATCIKFVNLPDTIEKISDGAFQSCTNMTEIQISKNLIEVGSCAFLECDLLFCIDLSMETMTKIYEKAFYGCDNLTEVLLGNNIILIDDEAFSGCISLQKADLPKNLQELGTWTFCNCTVLKSVTIPKTLTKWGEHTFANNYNLRTVIFEEGIERIGSWGNFAGCKSLETVTIPSSAKYLGDTVFAYCDNLKLVSFLGDAPEYVGYKPFRGDSMWLEIYYNSGTKGWDTSSLNEYNLFVQN